MSKMFGKDFHQHLISFDFKHHVPDRFQTNIKHGTTINTFERADKILTLNYFKYYQILF